MGELGRALGQFAGEVEKQSLGTAILVGLLHTVLVVAEMLEVRALAGHAHCEGGGVDAEGCDEGHDRRVGVERAGFQKREEEKAEESTGEIVDLDGCLYQYLINCEIGCDLQVSHPSGESFLLNDKIPIVIRT